MSGILLSAVLLRLLPHGPGVSAYFYTYTVLMALMGLTASWPAAACIGPVFSEIVPDHLRRYMPIPADRLPHPHTHTHTRSH